MQEQLINNAQELKIQSLTLNDEAFQSLEISKEEIEKMQFLTVTPTSENVLLVTDFIEEKLSEKGIDFKTIIKMNIAIDEIFSNIVQYSKATVATIGVFADEKAVKLRFIDDGIPYDPTKTQDPDITLDIEDRSIGGLGVFMVKKTMDNVIYICNDAKNILHLTKKI